MLLRAQVDCVAEVTRAELQHQHVERQCRRVRGSPVRDAVRPDNVAVRELRQLPEGTNLCACDGTRKIFRHT